MAMMGRIRGWRNAGVTGEEVVAAEYRDGTRGRLQEPTSVSAV